MSINPSAIPAVFIPPYQMRTSGQFHELDGKVQQAIGLVLVALMAAFAIHVVKQCGIRRYKLSQKSTITDCALALLKPRKPLKDYPLEGKKAFEFAQEEFLKVANPIENMFSQTNASQAIAGLARIYDSYLYKYGELIEAKRKAQAAEYWSDPEVLELADACMKISYVLSCLTLESLPSFCRKYATTYRNRLSHAEALSVEGSPHLVRFFTCTVMYHRLRGRLVPDKSIHVEGKPGWVHRDVLKMDDHKADGDRSEYNHEEDYYKPGKTQYGWNALYEDFCDRTLSYASKHELDTEFPLVCEWLQKYAPPKKGAAAFEPMPYRLPYQNFQDRGIR